MVPIQFHRFTFLLFTFVFGTPLWTCYVPSLANNKGYSAWRWFAGGVLFNILGLIVAAGLPDRLLRNHLREVLK